MLLLDRVILADSMPFSGPFSFTKRWEDITQFFFLVASRGIWWWGDRVFVFACHESQVLGQLPLYKGNPLPCAREGARCVCGAPLSLSLSLSLSLGQP